MPIDPRLEEPTRQMLAHAIKCELDELAAVIRAAGEETFREAIGLCASFSGYIVIDAIGKRWPSDVVLRQIARDAAEAVTKLEVSEAEIFAFLSRVVFGSETLDKVFSDDGIGRVPLFTTANLLLSFFRKGEHWFEYLDRIEQSMEESERIEARVLPALMLRVHQAELRRGEAS